MLSLLHENHRMGQDSGYRSARPSRLSSLGRGLRALAGGVAILFLLLQPFAVWATGITQDNATWQSLGSVSSGSFSYTNSGDFLAVFVFYYGTTGNSDKVTGCTYNGVGLTQITSNKKTVSRTDATGDVTGYTFYSSSPATGAHTLACSASATAVAFTVAVDSFAGALGGLDNSSAGSGTVDGSNHFATNITVNTASSWVAVGSYSYGYNGYLTPYVQRAGSGHDTGDGDSNGTVSTGTNTITMTSSVSGRPAINEIVSISPTVASAASFAPWQFWEF